ncbi:hypothetical protein [Aquimarina sp. RZ0]|uniref:hypothetical protein n=1 Tax=Aquimarina sp. RZ0 TaxID=2607730 RepID=UPI0011F0BEBD|nr:hypothetical protein [Aquimarina sp. RZ0]KAA1246601.1 hypothetical protein F0000_06865 [Aquimarina sp. RZ0]
MKKLSLITKFLTLLVSANILFGQTPYQTNQYLEDARKNKFLNFEKATHNYKKSIEYFAYKKDTFNLINSINELSELYGHNLDFDKSYDGYWRALYLAEESNDQFSKSRVYQSLGWLYSFYNRNKKALENLDNALNISKKLFSEKKISVDYLISDYFSIANFYRYNRDFETARKYVDSCYIFYNSENNETQNYYLEAEKGFLLAAEGEFPEAEETLEKSYEYFKNNNESYLVIIHYLFARVYQMKGEIEKSKFHFSKSLEVSSTHNSHMNYKIINHKELSKIYYDSKEYKEAFFHIEKAIELENKIFGINSKNNEYLFEIKDKYRIQKNEQEQILKEQKLLKLEHKQKISLLRSTLLFVTLFFLLVFGYMVFKNLKRKHKREKILLKQKQRIKLKETKKAIELKNKELAKSALQLIEKDEFIASLKNALTENKEDLNLTSINKVIKSIQSGVGSNWKEFEARFIDINQDFYKKIKKDFPALTQTDLKICALIKLNFSSKDMASLLGISIESVHTSRYRLRKKLKLERNDNLVEFVSQY